MPLASLDDTIVPKGPGIYIVVRDAGETPTFLSASGAGHCKSKDPTVEPSFLQAAWVDGASVLYIGKASDRVTGRRGLRKRLNEYRRHGNGKPVGHWGGRYIWQLSDRDELLVAWKVTPDEDSEKVESSLIADFCEQYKARPFANRKMGTAPVDGA